MVCRYLHWLQRNTNYGQADDEFHYFTFATHEIFFRKFLIGRERNFQEDFAVEEKGNPMLIKFSIIVILFLL